MPISNKEDPVLTFLIGSFFRSILVVADGAEGAAAEAAAMAGDRKADLGSRSKNGAHPQEFSIITATEDLCSFSTGVPMFQQRKEKSDEL